MGGPEKEPPGPLLRLGEGARVALRCKPGYHLQHRSIPVLALPLQLAVSALFLKLLRFSLSLSVSHFSSVQLFATPWSVVHQAPMSMGFSGQEY